jgi:exodeoxyribonuclease-3
MSAPPISACLSRPDARPGDPGFGRTSFGHCRILTWNVQRASPQRSLGQAAWLASAGADVLVLTEVGAVGGRALSAALAAHGCTMSAAPDVLVDYGVLLAVTSGRLEVLTRVTTSFLPHRCVAARWHWLGGTVGIVGVYVPSRGGARGRNVDKRAFQTAFIDLLPGLSRALDVEAVVVAGDLNVIEPGHVPHHSGYGTWEYDFYRAFARHGYTDAYRLRNPYRTEHSWIGRRTGAGYRFDHIFCSPSASSDLVDVQYLHESRLAGLSDHSAMVVTLSVA